jgi:outer membrane protein OmpA-like peptidoglycan-associated protein
MTDKRWFLALFLVSSAALAQAPATLNVITYPDKRSVDVPFTATSRAPTGASLDADVYLKEGQARIDVNYLKMQPAVLFGGNVTSYVVWAVGKTGIPENLGELWLDGENGSARFQTGQKEFAMFVTAEPVAGIWRPSDMIVFVSGPTGNKYSKNSTLAFTGLAAPVRHDRESIGTMRWTGTEPIALYQARKAYEMGTELGLEQFDPKSMREAQTTLAQATNSQGSGGSSKVVTDYSRRTVATLTAAARAYYKDQQDKAEAAAAAKRRAEMDALSAKATTAEESAATADAARRQAETEKGEAERAKAEMAVTAAALESQKKDLEVQMAALATEKEAAEKAKADAIAERDALSQRLVGALTTVADTQNTARGVVVNLSDILFDTNKASLKPEAQLKLAKLTGVLTVFPNLNLRVEGYTDSTGTDAINDKLSRERAASVQMFLQSQGIDGSRMTSQGYGSQHPVASNDTKEGKAKNRRVEIVLAEGVVAEPER